MKDLVFYSIIKHGCTFVPGQVSTRNKADALLIELEQFDRTEGLYKPNSYEIVKHTIRDISIVDCVLSYTADGERYSTNDHRYYNGTHHFFHKFSEHDTIIARYNDVTGDITSADVE